MKMMHGACALPCSNRSRTLLAPTPTNISTKSDPDIEKKGRPASPATARARRVLPVPGGPTSNAPFGKRPPSLVNFCGSFRNSMISCSSTFASSAPATSSNVTLGVSPVRSFAFDLPKLNAVIAESRDFVARVFRRQKNLEFRDEAPLHWYLLLELPSEKSAGLDGNLINVVLLQLLIVLRSVRDPGRGLRSLP